MGNRKEDICMKTKFPVLTKEERVRRLMPPRGKVKMVLDTDTYNEVDDQFALSYALLSPEKLDVQAVYAAPFSSEFFSKLLNTQNIGISMTGDLEEGLEQSYREILKIYELLGIDPSGMVFKGSNSYMKRPEEPVESDAAKDLIRKAMECEDVLYVVSIGEITNVASAILMEPEIIKKIVVIWLSGQPLDWPHAVEFNLGQDIFASQIIFDSGVPLVLIPCMTVASHLTTTEAELREQLKGKSAIGTYLADNVIEQLSQEAAHHTLALLKKTYLQGIDDYEEALSEEMPSRTMAPSRIIWDISAIGYMINPDWCPSLLVPAPIFTDDMKWKREETRHLIRLCRFVYRDGIFGDMFYKLRKS